MSDSLDMLEQSRIAATVFSRAEADWIGHIFLEAALLQVPEIGFKIPLAEFYEGLTFDSLDATDA
ncbi:hypothetical protein [Beijerinckia indica]|uniref:hypothetical protein n=1 Tax=Beijerinckia indica TaxID=533 RepID=UPI0011D06AAD|nr:hypothetical protein [Beijerinckia indica]